MFNLRTILLLSLTGVGAYILYKAFKPATAEAGQGKGEGEGQGNKQGEGGEQQKSEYIKPSITTTITAKTRSEYISTHKDLRAKGLLAKKIGGKPIFLAEKKSEDYYSNTIY